MSRQHRPAGGDPALARELPGPAAELQRDQGRPHPGGVDVPVRYQLVDLPCPVRVQQRQDATFRGSV
jgi:hypothetical protein